LTAPSTRSSARRSRSLAVSGAGPTTERERGEGWPGAEQKFALFAEVMATGIIVAVLSLPVVTLPLAVAAGHRHLLRFLRAQGSPLSLIWRDVRAGILGGLGIGAAWLAVTLAMGLNLMLVSSGVLPGGAVVGAASVAVLAVVLVVVLRAAAEWTPADGWRVALARGARVLAGDATGSLYVIVAAAIAVVVTWMLPPLIVPALGCVCFALVTITARRAAREQFRRNA
jgi:hypothetical protein